MNIPKRLILATLIMALFAPALHAVDGILGRTFIILFIMPRIHRFEFPGSLVHIMARGLNGMAIFRDDEDRSFFLSYFSSALKISGYECHAWTLMNNHYHLLVRSTDLPMSKLMRPLNGSYGIWHNKKYDRRGYLFQDRFKSVLCQDQEYARQVIRYIHLNPLRAGNVKDLQELRSWKWCGHGYLIGASGAIGGDFQNRSEVLRRFGNTEKKAVKRYLEFLDEDIGDPTLAGILSGDQYAEIAISHKGLPAIIGNAEFVREALRKNKHRIAAMRRFKNDPEALDMLAQKVCAKYKISGKELKWQGRCNARSAARREFCAKAYDELHALVTNIARYLDLTPPPVSIMLRQWKESTLKIK